MPTTATREHKPATSARGPSYLRRAWICVALLPVAFVAATLIGDGLISAQGYEVGADEPVPLAPTLWAAIPAMAVLVAPGVAALWYGSRASRPGRLPALIGGSAVVILIALNLLALILGR